MAVEEPIIGPANEFETKWAGDSETGRRTVFSEGVPFWVKWGH